MFKVTCQVGDNRLARPWHVVGSGGCVKWRGDYDLLAPGEMAAFVSQLTALGYNPKAFRVTVRRAAEAPEGVLRYTVFVAQLWKRVPYRGSGISVGMAQTGSTNFL